MKIRFDKIGEDLKKIGRKFESGVVKISDAVSDKFKDYVEVEEVKTEEFKVEDLEVDNVDDVEVLEIQDLIVEGQDEVFTPTIIETDELDIVDDLVVLVEEPIEEVEIVEIRCPYCGDENYKNLSLGGTDSRLHLCLSCDKTFLVKYDENWDVVEIQKTDDITLG